MSIDQFTFGKPDFTFFCRDKHTPILRVLVWYKSAYNGNKYVNFTVSNNAAEGRNEALEDALRYATEFVRERWFLVEVTTPTRLFMYGSQMSDGGERRLRVLRSVEPITAPDTYPCRKHTGALNVIQISHFHQRPPSSDC